jgi:hypothetical protein
LLLKHEYPACLKIPFNNFFMLANDTDQNHAINQN